MDLRVQTELWECERLGPGAACAAHSAGRPVAEAPCEIRTAYQRDRDRITHSKSFRRLKHKTQVFLSPEGDHYRTRLTHTLEVSQIARTIARAMKLNEDLTEAIALGHDLGHTPFGHAGEMELNQLHPGGFRHNEQSLRVVDVLEEGNARRAGLNLTMEVRDGILNHCGPQWPQTLEGQVVRHSDRIAYINHDIDDALRAHVVQVEDFPVHFFERLGHSHGQRINGLISDLIQNSTAQGSIGFSDEVNTVFSDLRDFMFDAVYLNERAKKQEAKARHLIRSMYQYFTEAPEKMPGVHYARYAAGAGPDAVRDYIAGMTDRYAVHAYQELFVPSFWQVYD